MTVQTQDAARPEPGDEGGRPLRRDERVTLALLGVPTFALALAITTVTAYLPVQARQFLGSTLVIGLIVGTQGLVALWVPLVAGTWSDRLRTRLGGRLPFLVAATPVAALALVAMGLAGAVGPLAVAVVVFFVAYFAAYEPYRALYPDAVPDEVAGRAQSSQAVFRGAGTGLALLGGGLLLALARPAPFVAAAAVLVLTMAAFTLTVARRGVPEQQRSTRPVRGELRHLLDLVRSHPPLRHLLAANALWELSLAALSTFVILYLTDGLGLATSTAALAVGGGAVFVLAGAVASGPLADRHGAVRVLRLTLPVYGLGLLVPVLTQSAAILAPVAAVVGLGGGVVMALPYAVLIPLMPKEDHGSVTGLYSVSRGVGITLGPLLAGLAIGVLDELLAGTRGYAATWLVCGFGILASLPLVRRLRAAVGDERER